MYSIYARINDHSVCLHDDTVSNSDVKVIDPVLTLEDSSAGSLTFKLAPNNIGYTEQEIETTMAKSISSNGTVTYETVTETVDLVGRMRSTITVYRDGVEIWEGRVLSEDRDFQNLRDIYCEGELAYLNDTCQPQRQYHDLTIRQFLEAVLKLHNSRVEDSKKFYIGSVTVNDNNDSGYRTTNFEKTMETVNNLVAENGGHLRIRKVNGKRYLDYLADYPNTSSQQIKFGSNLLDFTCSWDMSQLCTVVMPTGHVVQEAGTSTVGNPLTPLNSGGVPTTGQLLYVDSNTGRIEIKAEASLSGYRTAEYVVKPGNNYYVSCRLHGGYVAYAMYILSGGTYMVHTYQTAGSASQLGFTDYVDQKIEIPAGVTRLIVCGFGTDIPVSVKNEIEAEEEFDEYLTVEDVNTDGDWHQKGSVYIVNQEMVSKYGWIEKQLSLSDIEDKNELYKTAKTYLQDGQFDEMTIEISAIDLSIMGIDVAAINLLDKVRVISEPHDLDKLFPVTKLEIPLNKPSEQKFTIGTNTQQNLTSVNNDINEQLLAKITATPSATLASAQRNAAMLINTATTGFITFIMDESTGKPKELLITDEADYTKAQHVWRWNINGLGYSNKGYNADQYLSAMTMDGAIVADRITTGQLSSITIRGCDAVFGGMDNRDGTILIKSGNSTGYCVQLRDGGIFFGYLNSDGTIDEFGKIQDNKVYGIDGEYVRGLVIDSKVIALDVDNIWVSSKSSYSGGGTDALGGRTETLQVCLMDGNGSIYSIPLTFRHGILM